MEEEPKYYETEGKGKKRCPGCKKIVGCRRHVCYCGHDFKSGGEEEKNGEKTTPLTAELMAYFENRPYVAPPELTKRQHAERILGLGPVRAKILLLQHKIHHYWPHIDWDLVKFGLGE